MRVAEAERGRERCWVGRGGVGVGVMGMRRVEGDEGVEEGGRERVEIW